MTEPAESPPPRRSRPGPAPRAETSLRDVARLAGVSPIPSSVRDPTHHYKTGVVFLAYLTGHQSHFRMIGGHEGARSIIHLSQLLRLADQAGLIADPELAAIRMRPLLTASGID